MSVDIMQSKEIQLAIMLKTQQLKREDLSTLTTEHLYNTLLNLVWKRKHPKSVHEAVRDIMDLNVATIVNFLSIDAIQKGAKVDKRDLSKLVGGE